MKLDDFEGVFAVCFTGNRDRHARLLEELKRVSLDNKVQTIWMFPSPYRKLIKYISHIQYLHQNDGYLGATIGQYKAIKTAYELGMQNVLIVEDDCRFHKDLMFVEKSLAVAPKDWDMLMLDHFKLRGTVKKIDNYWTTCDASASTACYAINRKAMERLIDMYESPVSGKYKNPVLRASDHWTDKRYIGKDINFYCAVPNIAVQCICPGPSNCGRLHCIPKYEGQLKISVNDYAQF